jgi:poly(hydroxyalkanoate) depolymerase family esterase
MLRLRRAIAKSAGRAASANLRAAADALQALTEVGQKPKARKRPAAKPKTRKAKALAKPRNGLAETVAWIAAGGMPARPAATRRKAAVPRGASFALATFSGDQGKRSYKLYVPARARTPPGTPPSAPMPLVVMLHGCEQTPDDFAAGTRMNALAEEFGILVAYPSQPSDANANRCWNWFNRGDQLRGAGEPALIAGIVRQIIREHPVDPARVYVAGLSAGGSAANILGAAYPDLFAAVGVHSGLPVGAAHNSASAFVAMRQGAPGDRPTTSVPTIVFHGAADPVVHPRNGRFIAARALSALPRLRKVERSGRSPGGRSYSTTTHRGKNSKPYCEHWVVEGSGHAWSGGHASGSYTDPAGPNASREMLRFFLRHRLSARDRKLGGAPGG